MKEPQRLWVFEYMESSILTKSQRRLFFVSFICLGFAFFFTGCKDKGTRHDPIPDGLSKLRITGPAGRTVFFSITVYEKKGKTTNSKSWTVNNSLNDGNPYELEFKKGTGVDISVWIPFADEVKVDLLAGDKVVASKTSNSPGSELDFTFGRCQERRPDLFKSYRATPEDQLIIDRIIGMFREGNPEDLDDFWSEKRIHQNLPALAVAIPRLKSELGELAPGKASSDQWSRITTTDTIRFSSSLQFGDATVPVTIRLSPENKVELIAIMRPKPDFEWFEPNAAADSLRKTSLQLVEHVLNQRTDQAAAMGRSEKLTADFYKEWAKKLDHYEFSGPPEFDGLYKLRSIENEEQIAVQIHLPLSKNEEPVYAVAAYSYLRPATGKPWEALDFYPFETLFRGGKDPSLTNRIDKP